MDFLTISRTLPETSTKLFVLPELHNHGSYTMPTKPAFSEIFLQRLVLQINLESFIPGSSITMDRTFEVVIVLRLPLRIVIVVFLSLFFGASLLRNSLLGAVVLLPIYFLV